jgi:AmmeMemoRadiSam system radical SAM enzyme
MQPTRPRAHVALHPTNLVPASATQPMPVPARHRVPVFVRGRVADQVVLTSYGRSSGFCVDPIEKKPLNHFLPGSAVLSFGTAGCNLACRFCQNWDISKSREIDRLADAAGPDDIAEAAVRLGCRSVAMTYNDPVISGHALLIGLLALLDRATSCKDIELLVLRHKFVELRRTNPRRARSPRSDR